MVTLTVKVPEETMRRLKKEAKDTGRTVAAIVRERIERGELKGVTVYDLCSDLIGAAGDGPGISATNDRPKFKHLFRRGR